MAADDGWYLRRARWVGLVLGGTALATLLTACGGEQIWTTYTSDDGLVSDAVASVTAGSDGTVWAATRTGLARFDG